MPLLRLRGAGKTEVAVQFAAQFIHKYVLSELIYQSAKVSIAWFDVAV